MTEFRLLNDALELLQQEQQEQQHSSIYDATHLQQQQQQHSHSNTFTATTDTSTSRFLALTPSSSAPQQHHPAVPTPSLLVPGATSKFVPASFTPVSSAATPGTSHHHHNPPATKREPQYQEQPGHFHSSAPPDDESSSPATNTRHRYQQQQQDQLQQRMHALLQSQTPLTAQAAAATEPTTMHHDDDDDTRASNINNNIDDTSTTNSGGNAALTEAALKDVQLQESKLVVQRLHEIEANQLRAALSLLQDERRFRERNVVEIRRQMDAIDKKKFALLASGEQLVAAVEKGASAMIPASASAMNNPASQQQRRIGFSSADSVYSDKQGSEEYASQSGRPERAPSIASQGQQLNRMPSALSSSSLFFNKQPPLPTQLEGGYAGGPLTKRDVETHLADYWRRQSAKQF